MVLKLLRRRSLIRVRFARRARDLGVLPSEVAFIGDTTVDMAASQGAGSVSVAALYGYGVRNDLLATSPAHAIERVTQLIEIL